MNPIDYTSPILKGFSSGLGNAIAMGQLVGFADDRKERQLVADKETEIRETNQALLKQASELYKTGNPDQIATFSLEHPEVGEYLNKQIGFKNDRTKQQMLETSRAILANPQDAGKILARRVAFLDEQGADPTHTLQAFAEWRENPEAFLKSNQMFYAGHDPKGWETLKSSNDHGTFSNIIFDEFNRPWGLNSATQKFEKIGGGLQKGETKPQTVVNVGGQNEQSKVIGKNEGEVYNGFVKAAVQSRKDDINLNQMLSFNDEAFSGTLAPIRKNLSKIASSFGINIDGLAETEIFEAIANQGVLNATTQLSGVLTDKDMEFLETTVPKLTQTKEGRKRLIKIQLTLNELKREKAKLAAKYRKEHNGNFDAVEFDEWLVRQDKPNRFEGFYVKDNTSELSIDDLLKKYGG